MKLKSISIKGFKSFAERTEIEFPKGITIIVGPNGSGKSNISDALRWVFGEMSWKNLRGEKMEDVIYQGSKNRSPLGFAEVEIVLDNSDKFLHIEYNEVSILRKLYRSGESIFMINRKEVRAKDVRNLLMDTGLGKDGYSIIGQGRIDNILSERPEDRRAVFEEVAGIAKYKARKIEAERKLSRTSDNLQSIDDILHEIANSYETVKEEAERTREYQRTFEELKNIDLVLSMREYQKLKERKNDISMTLKERSLEVEEKESERSILQSKYSELKEIIEETKKKEGLIAQESDTLRREREEISQEVSVRENTITFYDKEIKRLRDEIEKIEDEITLFSKDQVQYEKNYNETKKIYEELAIEREDIKNKLGDVSIENKIKEENYLKEELIKIGKNLEVLKERIKFNETSLSDNEIKIIEIEDYIENKKNTIEELEELLRGLSQKTDLVFSDLKKNEKIFNNTMERKSVLEREKAELIKEQESTIFNNKSLNSELYALRQMEENYEGYQRPVKFLMSLSNKSERGILGTVSELFKVEKKFQVAIENALGGQLQNVVVQKDTDAEELIRLLKENRAGRTTFLPLNRIEARIRVLSDRLLNTQGIFGMANDLIEFEDIYKNIFSNLLGNTLVVDHLKTALSIPKEDIKYMRIITLEGEVISHQGAITGGYYNKQAGFFSRKNKIEDLEARIAQGDDEIKKIQEKIEIKQSAIDEIDKSIEAVSYEIERLNRDNQSELREKEKIQLKYQAESELLGTKAEELNLLRESAEKINKELQSLKAQREDGLAKEISLNDDLRIITNSMGKDREQVAKLTAKLNELELRLQNIKHNLERFEENKDRVVKALSNLKSEREIKNKEIESANKNYSMEKATAQAKRESLEEVIKFLEQKEREREEYKNKSDGILKELYELQKNIEENAE